MASPSTESAECTRHFGARTYVFYCIYKPDMQFSYDVTLRRVRVITVAMETQQCILDVSVN
jgi:hypothetical protein